MENILVPCDFSKSAIGAYRQALDIAALSKGIVHLLHVVESPILDDTVLMPSLYEKLKDKLCKAESQFKDLIKNNGREHVKSKFDMQIGSVTKSIQEYIADHDIDLVIMGSTEATGLKEYFKDSNVKKVVQQSQVPVIVIKNYYDQPVKRIVFPNALDSEHQDDLVMKVKDLQHFFKAKLFIVYIKTPADFVIDNDIRQQLLAFANHYMFKDYTVNVLHYASAEQGIIEFTKMIGGDMIALGTHGHKVHFLKGSVADEIVNHVESPIWTYRMTEELIEEAG